MRQPKSSRGFTLVELLVVIGIIAILIAILLPSLSAARRQANAVKCAAGLRDLGNAFKFYAIDQNGWYPPAQLNGLSANSKTYTLDNGKESITYPLMFPGSTTKHGAYWFNFLNKYITKAGLGTSATETLDSGTARRSLVFGCPAFEGYPPIASIASIFEVNPYMTGYAMNVWPTANENTLKKDAAAPSYKDYAWDACWGDPAQAALDGIGYGPSTGGFQKATTWGKRGAERMLLADGRIWSGHAGAPKDLSGQPRTQKQVPTQAFADTNNTASTNETTVSFWRHGKLPPKEGGFYNPNKSKVAYNVLYCDGHVATETEAYVAYKAIRMRYPN